MNVRTRRECLDVLQTVFGSPFGTVLVVVEHDDELAWKVAWATAVEPHGQQRGREKRLEGGINFMNELQKS